MGHNIVCSTHPTYSLQITPSKLLSSTMVKTMVHCSYSNQECGNIWHVPHVENEGCGNEAHAILFWIDEHWELSPCKPWNLMLSSNPSLTFYYWIDNHLYCAASFVANFFAKNNILSIVPLKIPQIWKNKIQKIIMFLQDDY